MSVIGKNGIGVIGGQEKNTITYNLARMNMLLHGVKDTEFEIYHGDTLQNAWDMLCETKPTIRLQLNSVQGHPAVVLPLVSR